MAEIPVEKTNRGWLWPVLLVLAAIVIVAIILWPRNDYDGVAASSPPTATSPVTETNGPIADLSRLIQPNNPDALDGTQVDIKNARVLSVTGDKSFWVGQDASNQVLVVLDEQATPSLPFREGRYDVNPGQSIEVQGQVRKFPGFDEARDKWKIDPKLKSQFEDQKIYIAANKLSILSRPTAQ